jgi:hypothetical protein
MLRRFTLASLALLLLGSALSAHHLWASGSRFFPQSGYAVGEPFLSFWQQGGVETYGYPISPELPEASPDDGQVRTVQYFERARLELHPESAQPVQLGRLGAEVVAVQAPAGEAVDQSEAAGCLTFAETRQRLCGRFAELWRERGGLAVFGLPLSPPLLQRASDGRPQMIQYTERARFELSPSANQVSLGLLGRERYIAPPGVAGPQLLALDPVAARLVELINQERAAAGLAPVVPVPELMAAALTHSQGMAASGLISHSGADGRGPAERMRDAGYDWRRCGENIAVAYTTPEQAMDFWMNSPPHRANILDPGMNEVGVSHVEQPDGWRHYWTVNLGER